ncbi:hypothetical protein DdX_15379 [Ditylenchus destructor]|uniref:G-protein coupled receptors family 1 profile domain-containing protein n=1 Tax=Ditylenchus destructor TaxID=166010 RepID=A0AAD4MSE2_9BILA|nr:hypothetical protein DdX_15379 [Ditylenchus destructor]
MDSSAVGAAAASAGFGGFSLDIPHEVNHTAIALLLNQLNQQKQECRETQPVEISCEDRPLNKILLGYGFLVVFCFALIGNCLNLFIYNSDQIRFYIAIRMLCTKLLMNTLMMAFLVPQAFRIISVWEPGSSSDLLYWKFWPYQAYFINVFGFCAMWLTVLMTAECYIHVFFPGQSKAICNKQNLSRSYLLIGVVGLILALIYPLNRNVSLMKNCNSLRIAIVASHSEAMITFERFHTIANLLLAIIIPLVLLVFMTASIVWRLIIRPPDLGSATSQHFSSEKRGVTRITLITTALQLITETPSVPVFIYATVFGPNIGQNMCTWQTVSHFLGLCNASLSFFVYITFSNRFRNSMIGRAELLFYQCCPRCFHPPNAIGTLKNTLTSAYISRTSSFRRSGKFGFLPPTNSFNSAKESFRSECLLAPRANTTSGLSPKRSTIAAASIVSLEERGIRSAPPSTATCELLRPFNEGSSCSSPSQSSGALNQMDAFL